MKGGTERGGATGARRSGARCAGVLLVAASLCGCSAQALRVTGAETSVEEARGALPGFRPEPREVFGADDERVTLNVRFGRNFVATFFVYQVEWLAPGGRSFRRAPVRTHWGTHRTLSASLPIRGTPAARLPGRWTVRLFLHGRELVERHFRLVEDTPAGASPDPASAPSPASGE